MNAPARIITGAKPAFSKERAGETKKAIKRFEAHLAKGGKGLWDHQSKAMTSVGAFLSASLEAVSNGESVSGAIVMPTGAGKTVVAAEITKGLGTRALILAPTIKIVQQHKEELAERVPTLDAAIYRSSKGLDSEVVVMTYHAAVSLMKKGALPDDFGVVFYDEAHRSLSFERSKLHGSVSQLEIGLTATPAYDEMTHIWNVFDDNIFTMDLPEAVEAGVLSPLRGYIIPTSIDVRDIKLRQGEDNLDGVKAEKFLNVMARNMAAKEFYLEKFNGTPSVVFCVSKRHAEHFADYMRAFGVKAAHIHGSMSMEKREEVLEAFESGKIDMLTSVDVLIEGWDSKRVILAMNLRPTYSRVVKAHMVGRVMRARGGKEAGIFAEFQDMYGHGQQPVLVHHLMERANFRQGGLVAAPAKKIASEEAKLKEGRNVAVSGKVKVGFKVNPVVRLEKVGSDYDLRDPKVLEEILDSRPDIDWANTPASHLRDVTLDHPAFTGSLITLIHKVFGIPNRMGSQLKTAEDIKMFLWYAIENRMIAADDERLEIAAQFGSSTSSRNPKYARGESAYELIELSKAVKEVLETLTPMEKKTIEMRFGDVMELNEVGKEFWITRERVRQLEAKALKKLRHPSRSKFLRPYKEINGREAAFNADHSYRYEMVTEQRHVVELVRAQKRDGIYRKHGIFQKPKLELSEPLKRYLERELGKLLDAESRARNWGEKKRLFEKAGFASRFIEENDYASLRQLLELEFEKITGHGLKVSVIQVPVLGEVGGRM